MIAFRISRKARITDLSGTGAKLYGGRWNSIGRPVLYCAENISLAMLEILVQADHNFLQKEFSVAFLNLNPALRIKEISAGELAPFWRSNPHSAVTQRLGDEWLKNTEMEILKVPSAVNPLESNILVNPARISDSDIEIVAQREIEFDKRLTL